MLRLLRNPRSGRPIDLDDLRRILGQRLTISATPPRLGAAYVQSVSEPPGRPFPATGTVFQIKAPVLRFVVR